VFRILNVTGSPTTAEDAGSASLCWSADSSQEPANTIVISSGKIFKNGDEEALKLGMGF
jgi:hypothetical protein